MEDSKLNGIIYQSLSNIKQIVDVNTVVGKPVTTTGGTVIIPVSKVSIGFASGGLDFYGKNSVQAAGSKDANFGGGGGTGVTLNPVGFLVTHADGSVEYLPVSLPGPANGGASAPSDKLDTVIDFVERSPEIVEKILRLFGKKDTSDSSEENED